MVRDGHHAAVPGATADMRGQPSKRGMKAMSYIEIVARGLASLLGTSLIATPGHAGDELLTDKVVIENRTPRPPFGSGTRHILVRVGGATPSAEKRDYYITYFGADQPLPEVGATCDIIYRNGAVDGSVFETLPKVLPDLVRYVRRFSCVGPDMVYDEREYLTRAREASRRRR